MVVFLLLLLKSPGTYNKEKRLPYKPELLQNRDTRQAIEQQQEIEIKREKKSS